MDYNRTDKTELDEYTSGYSTAKTSPQTSNEDLLRLRVRSRQYSSSDTEESDNYSDEEGITEEEEDLVEHCEFRPVVRSNELDPYKEWYHKLLTMRTNYKNGENAFPPFPPPPLPSTMLAASRAQAINLFEEVKRAAVKATVSPNHSAVDIAAHRFCPHDFQILPPPHVFLDIKEEEHHETEVSSQSSSGGEYSDASEETLFVERTKREKNCQRDNSDHVHTIH
uniref:Uncharacterized protein n=1 Tax=Caenorhabditis japonica TaxID=281687 RepID=A0A8R1DRJ9_CAEJA